MPEFIFFNRITKEELNISADSTEEANILIEEQTSDPENWVGVRSAEEDPIGLFDEFEYGIGS